MLRAYSQGVFSPQSVFEEESTEVGFTNRIEEHMKAFIIKQLAGDTNAIRKEVKLLIINVYILCIYICIFRLCLCIMWSRTISRKNRSRNCQKMRRGVEVWIETEF